MLVITTSIDIIVTVKGDILYTWSNCYRFFLRLLLRLAGDHAKAFVEYVCCLVTKIAEANFFPAGKIDR